MANEVPPGRWRERRKIAVKVVDIFGNNAMKIVEVGSVHTIGKFILKDVRCFEGQNEFNIRPLTFLVGENSTGKSTMLGCFQALNDFMTGFLPANNVDFNKEPYQMGAFADIARKTRSIAKSFELGFEYEKIQYVLTLVAREDGSEPVIRQIKNIFEDGELIIKVERTKNGKSPDKKKEFNIKEPEKNKFVLSVKDNSRLNRNRHFPKIDFLLHIIEGESQAKELSSAQKNLISYLDGKRKYARLRDTLPIVLPPYVPNLSAPITL